MLTVTEMGQAIWKHKREHFAETGERARIRKIMLHPAYFSGLAATCKNGEMHRKADGSFTFLGFPLEISTEIGKRFVILNEKNEETGRRFATWSDSSSLRTPEAGKTST